MPDTGARIRGEAINETSVNVGAKAGDNIQCLELGNSVLHQTVLSLTSRQVTVANTTGASFGSTKLYGWPAGRIQLLGGVCNLSFDWAGQDIVATGSGDFSFGTTATADATLNSTEVDLMASTAMLDPFVAGVGTGTGVFVVPTNFDGTTTAKDMYLNIIIDDADVSDAASDIVLVSGEVRFTWINLGDY